jgi:transposase-like protein
MTENVMMKPRTRMMWTAAERAEWLALFERSGQSVAEFCRHNDLSPATLYFWLRQQGATSEENGALVEVPLAMAAALDRGTVAFVAAELPNGLRLQVPVGADITWLSALLQSVAKV